MPFDDVVLYDVEQFVRMFWFLLQVYVRPADCYVMDRLELRRITFYPVVNSADIVILVGNFSIPAGLRVAEAALSSRTVCLFSPHLLL